MCRCCCCCCFCCCCCCWNNKALALSLSCILFSSNRININTAHCDQLWITYSHRAHSPHTPSEWSGYIASQHSVARTTTRARILYASPAWWGLANENVMARLERLYTSGKSGRTMCQATRSAQGDEKVSAWLWQIHHLSLIIYSFKRSPTQAPSVLTVNMVNR